MTKQTKTIEDYPELMEWAKSKIKHVWNLENHNNYNFSKSDVEEKLLSMQARIDELTEQNKELKTSAKKAFWWSAEFTHVVHGGKIQQAWEDYKNKLNKESK